jgi:hypothetical protein
MAQMVKIPSFHRLQAPAAVMVLLTEMVAMVVQAVLVLMAPQAVLQQPDKAAQVVFPQTSSMAVAVVVLVQLAQTDRELLEVQAVRVQLLA